ncbi:MAG: MoaD/ThiS family protein [Nitrospira sp.]|nr:MoaD/ThiS family protein [Nitrospira sp.]
MPVTVKIPVPLQRITEGKEEVTGEPGTIIALINSLDKQYPGLAERISEDGKLRRFVNVYVNEEDVRFMKNEETEVKDGDEISIVPAIAGGR